MPDNFFTDEFEKFSMWMLRIPWVTYVSNEKMLRQNYAKRRFMLRTRKRQLQISGAYHENKEV